MLEHMANVRVVCTWVLGKRPRSEPRTTGRRGGHGLYAWGQFVGPQLLEECLVHCSLAKKRSRVPQKLTG